ncbi:uncharacterized protein LOC127240569 [Andrographis paniculata]|uniref:uncharacterized protein LOC127240569 n=1 Tax=Andrographis paniculata TaxID=175694 RepID=UPI0021E8E2B0|nr:uncharacterized protein LOC127240569 [Andrographis paniculata]
MATLQKFKLLATQCAVAGSPTRSPTTSPVIHLRRRKTLRMLLGREDRRIPAPYDGGDGEKRRPPEKGKDLSVRQKLKDLFVASPPANPENLRQGFPPSGGGGGRRSGARSMRPLTATFRQRLLRRAWRPALVAIPE